MLSNHTVEVAPVASALGAEIRGVDLREPLSEAAGEQIREAFPRYGVIFFRDQELTPAPAAARAPAI